LGLVISSILPFPAFVFDKVQEKVGAILGALLFVLKQEKTALTEFSGEVCLSVL
jgi:hypothetical protein